MILKSYNGNEHVMKMTKKPMLESEKACPDEPIDKDLSKKTEKRGN